ncbi:MAG: hypothetical protein HYU02_04265 [Thaumarchaeota archaeon]|nr:hypothetical protein [Nitrososphaerota archaeon]
MAGYESNVTLERIAKRLVKSGMYTVTGEEGAKMLREAAYNMGIDLRKADLEKTKKILAKGTPLSYIVRGMRNR